MELTYVPRKLYADATRKMIAPIPEIMLALRGVWKRSLMSANPEGMTRSKANENSNLDAMKEHETMSNSSHASADNSMNALSAALLNRIPKNRFVKGGAGSG